MLEAGGFRSWVDLLICFGEFEELAGFGAWDVVCFIGIVYL